MDLLKDRLTRGWLAAIPLLAAAAPVMAQAEGEAPAPAPAGGGGGTTSFARMFFWSDSFIGLLMIFLLIIMSVATVALIIHYLLQNRRETIVPDATVDDIEGLLEDKKFRDAIETAEDDDSVFGEIMHAALAEASNGYGAMERAVEESGDLASARRIRSIELLNVFGAVGPMIGLFGTVYGMIVAFQTLAASGADVDPQQLAAGISTALVTTFWGLVVGIPAVAAAALIRNKIDALTTEAMVEAEALIGRFRPGAPGGAKKAKPAPAAAPKPKAS